MKKNRFNILFHSFIIILLAFVTIDLAVLIIGYNNEKNNNYIKLEMAIDSHLNCLNETSDTAFINKQVNVFQSVFVSNDKDIVTTKILDEEDEEYEYYTLLTLDNSYYSSLYNKGVIKNKDGNYVLSVWRFYKNKIIISERLISSVYNSFLMNYGLLLLSVIITPFLFWILNEIIEIIKSKFEDENVYKAILERNSAKIINNSFLYSNIPTFIINKQEDVIKKTKQYDFKINYKAKYILEDLNLKITDFYNLIKERESGCILSLGKNKFLFTIYEHQKNNFTIKLINKTILNNK